MAAAHPDHEAAYLLLRDPAGHGSSLETGAGCGGMIYLQEAEQDIMGQYTARLLHQFFFFLKAGGKRLVVVLHRFALAC